MRPYRKGDDADGRRRKLAALVAEYEADHGAFTADELASQQQADRDEAAGHRTRAKQRWAEIRGTPQADGDVA